MKILKTLFSSFRNAVLSVICAILVLVVVGMGLVLAAQAGERKPLMDRNAALEYALEDAGLLLSEITITKQKLDRESGNEHYEIEFYTVSYAYEYEINAVTGAVMGVDIEALFENPAMAGGSAAQPGDRQPADGTPESQPPVQEIGQENQQPESQEAPEGQQPGTESQTQPQQPASGGQEDQTQPQQPASGGQESQTQPQQPVQGAQQSSDIGLDRAKEIALNDAGLTSAEVAFTKAKQDLKDRIPVYDLEFVTSTAEYEYEIDAATGAVVDKSMEALDKTNTPSAAAGNDIGLDRAKEIAVAREGLQLSDVTFTKAKQDYDDGISIYELEFYTELMEYEYEINAATGDVLDSEAKGFQSTMSDGVGSSLSYIGIDRAKEIALGHAGCAASEAVFTKAKLEKDDGYTLYEIEFYKGSGEYEYCIEAFTGAVLDWEYDCDNSCNDMHHNAHCH